MRTPQRNRSQRGNQPPPGSDVQQAILGEEQTWAGGGREPMHPDDLEEDGYIEKDKLKQQLRSDDN